MVWPGSCPDPGHGPTADQVGFCDSPPPRHQPPRITSFRDTVRRAEDARGLIEQHGGQLRQIFWTLGEYDLVTVTDFPDDETATAVLLQIGALGNIRTTTMKAFDAEQMSAIIQRTG